LAGHKIEYQSHREKRGKKRGEEKKGTLPFFELIVLVLNHFPSHPSARLSGLQRGCGLNIFRSRVAWIRRHEKESVPFSFCEHLTKRDQDMREQTRLTQN
jgi:hypothetical protein